jgi:hypothetical protein
MPWLDDVKARHRNGVRFKLHPFQAEANPVKLREQLEPMIRLAQQVWLWLESRRLLRDFDSVQDDAFSNNNKCPETRPMRNLLVNAKSTPSPRLCRFNPLRYPRERLLTALSLLLWEPFSSPPDRLLAKLKNELSAPSAQWPDLIRSYERLWRQYN